MEEARLFLLFSFLFIFFFFFSFFSFPSFVLTLLTSAGLDGLHFSLFPLSTIFLRFLNSQIHLFSFLRFDPREDGMNTRNGGRGVESFLEGKERGGCSEIPNAPQIQDFFLCDFTHGSFERSKSRCSLLLVGACVQRLSRLGWA